MLCIVQNIPTADCPLCSVIDIDRVTDSPDGKCAGWEPDVRILSGFLNKYLPNASNILGKFLILFDLVIKFVLGKHIISFTIYFTGMSVFLIYLYFR